MFKISNIKTLTIISKLLIILSPLLDFKYWGSLFIWNLDILDCDFIIINKGNYVTN